MNLDQRIETLEKKQAEQDEITARRWMNLIEQGNPRAVELFEIAKQRRDAAPRARGQRE